MVAQEASSASLLHGGEFAIDPKYGYLSAKFVTS